MEARQLYDGLEVGGAESWRNLCFVRLFGPDRLLDGVVSLNDALARGGITIFESGRVDALRATSTLDARVFFPGGSVVEGRSQNRAIEQPVIVSPRAKDVELSVRCVEQRQPLVGGSTYGASRTILMPTARSGRMDQRRTWMGVAATATTLRTRTDTLDYAAVVEQAGDVLTEYKRALGEPQRRQVGYVVAIRNGRSDGFTAMYADLFGNAGLYARLSGKLHEGVAVAARHARHDDVYLAVDRNGFLGFLDEARSAQLVPQPLSPGLEGSLYLMDKPIVGSALVFGEAPVQVSLRKELN